VSVELFLTVKRGGKKSRCVEEKSGVVTGAP